MKSICGQDCCGACSHRKRCGGCRETGGHPFGGNCVEAKSIMKGGFEGYSQFKQTLIEEINALKIPNLKVDGLNLLNGFFVNLPYTLPNGQTVKLLNDADVYLGNQIEVPNRERCYGVVADERYLLVCEYGCNGSDPEIVCYKRR